MGRAGGKDRGPGPVRRFYHRHGTDSFKAAAHVSSNLEEFATVILKAATVTPLSALMLAEALFQSGLPPSVLQVLTGYGNVIGDPLVKDERVRMISFTGGIEAGKRISQLAGIKKIGMELGSDSPVIVWDDADIAWAVESCVSGAFWAAGQNCIGFVVAQSEYTDIHSLKSQNSAIKKGRID